jgi:integrase
VFTRTRNQQGSLVLKDRQKGGKAWEFRYYEIGIDGRRRRRSVVFGARNEYATESAARNSPTVQAILLDVNANCIGNRTSDLSMGSLIARYERDEMPTRYSTRAAYQSIVNLHIRPRWADTSVREVKTMGVEKWLDTLRLAPKSKCHVKGVMHLIFECAQRWDLATINPIALVRVKDGTKRLCRPRVLTSSEFKSLASQLEGPYRMMVLIAGCLGLRVSEIVGLQWGDFDFAAPTVLVQRSVVHGRSGEVKTEYSRDRLPLAPGMAELLVKYRAECHSTAEGWLFANPRTGKPYHQEQIQKRHLKKAAMLAGISGKIGWHTFRHSYRSWLEHVGASLGVQKELMRHASIQTTMNIYGTAISETKQQIQTQVAEMLF